MKRLFRRPLRVFAAAMFAAHVFPAMPAMADTEILYATATDVPVLDPHYAASYNTRNFGYLVYDTLFAMDSNGEIQPQMVEEYTRSEDGLTWTFTLRDGLTFHDGAPVTSADVIASLNRWGPRDGLGKNLFNYVDALEAVDELTFEMKLSQPFQLVLDALGKPSSLVPFILPARLIEASPDKAITEVVGSGPFIFRADQWVSGETMVFDRNPDYKPRDEPADFLAGGKVAKVDRVRWRIIADANTRINALVAGEVDWIEAPQLDLLPVLRSNDQLVVSTSSGVDMFTGILRPNHASGPFTNPVLRRALWLAINQEEALAANGATGDLALICPAIFMCGGPLETDAGSPQRSVEAAKALLAEADYDGEPVVILQPTNVDALRGAADMISQQLREVGFNVDLQSMDWSALVARRAQREGWSAFPAFQHGFDASSPLTHFYISTNCIDAPGWPCDEKITALLDEFAFAATLDERKQISTAMQEAAYESVPFALWGQYSQPRAYKKELEGVIQSSIPILWNISK